MTFGGLYPGKYDLVVPVGRWLPRRHPAGQRQGEEGEDVVRDGAADPARAPRSTGTVVDANDPSVPLGGAAVMLQDGSGATLGSVTSAADGSFTLGGQLTTRSDLRVVAGPGPYSVYLGQGTHYCKYGQASVAVAVTTGQATALGGVPLPHLPDEQQDGAQCHTPPGPDRRESSPP